MHCFRSLHARFKLRNTNQSRITSVHTPLLDVFYRQRSEVTHKIVYNNYIQLVIS